MPASLLSPRWRALVCLGFGLGFAPAAQAAAADPAALLRNLEFRGAADAYAALPPASVAPVDRLRWAAALLNAQPRREQHVHHASRLLAEVAAADPVLAPGALLLAARLWQDHATPAQPDRARQLYHQLAARHPAHPLAATGLVRLTALDLAALPAISDTAFWQRLEQRSSLITTDAARRDFHWLFAQAWLDAGGDPGPALAHLQTAARLGFANRSTRANTLVQIAELARQIGDFETAAQAYRDFLHLHPRDGRRHFVAEILAGLPSLPATPSAATPTEARP